MAVGERRAGRSPLCRAARVLVALGVGLFAAVLAGCGGVGPDQEPAPASGEPQSIGIDNISIELPAGWNGYAIRIGRDDEVAVLWAANTPFSERSAWPEYPQQTLAALPQEGIAIEIVEQPRGIDLASWPLLAPPVRLADGYFLSESYEGQPAPHVSTQIIQARLADRALYIQVYFGRNSPDEEMRARADRVLATVTVAGGATETRGGGFVRFDDPPPPDPYAGWPLLVSPSGDSLRPPPGWAAAAAMYRPGKTPRPRAFFFASNRPLFGLPDRLVERVGRLPPSPAWAVANDLPADAVLLWVTEEEKGGESDEFPAIGRDWPGEDDFRPVEILTKSNPDVRWRRAGGSFRGYRFFVLIATGPAAAQADVELALKSAASLAISDCWRDVIDDCPDQ